MNVRPQVIATVMPLLSLVPVALYAAGQKAIAAVALGNVLIVAGCLYYMFSTAEADDAGHGVAH
ncbi:MULTISPECIES: hypothetical protein [Halobacterium]|uniref:DUF8131 domain-containing protein n=4 Tax=Halobacterium salinarum TaxID=2242 RepID=Q9HN92_HALSA|nr:MULTISPECIES: hypothetical protein [Halobacterium]AAG20329.1 hypothetical protein VNG_2197H [Halobacterium salinarum NRC-1]MBB6089347.1 hypothetical protein [Halobacterium salinarum]MCF2166384.1 hypothetical protein [Halobacterium salinarum]MCF2167283.1 hypothetical protein [Halobacterium salinarum]MCF2208478.1 hypothetical protein [Halobacterium salinarum]